MLCFFCIGKVFFFLCAILKNESANPKFKFEFVDTQHFLFFEKVDTQLLCIEKSYNLILSLHTEKLQIFVLNIC
jgi:hypothetical protein